MSTSKSYQQIIEEDFPQFDVALSMSDHHFRNLDFSPTDPKCVHRAIMQEWGILRESLPPNIFVRVNQRRIDLMTAVIIGAAGTPYHDGLHLFDIAFPDDYPYDPPLLHYRSYGLGINPLLSSTGRVCLRLTKRSSCREGEAGYAGVLGWNSSESSMLQVLVSLQALVLNDKPYYNQDFLFTTATEKHSDSYNEDVFVKSCKTMLHALNKPPQNFESLVMKHFSERGRLILEACVAYVQNTVKVGYYGCDASFKSDVSRKFKKTMLKLVPKMVDAFAWNGGRRNELESIVEQMKTMSCNETNYDQFVMSFLEMAKKVLGLKKEEKNGASLISLLG